MTKVSHSYFRRQIEAFFEDHDYDIVCRKRKSGYAIYWAEDNEPLARLRPTGRNDEVEVFWWGDDRWQRVGEFGSVMSLGDALEYVTDDPDQLFFGADEDAGDARDAVARLAALVREITHQMRRGALACALLAAATGGMFAKPSAGCLWATAVAMLLSVGFVMWSNRRFPPWFSLVVVVPTATIAAASGCVGASAHAVLGAGAWGATVGVLVGMLCCLLIFASPAVSWPLGFSAGLTLSAQLVDMMAWREHLFGLAIVALIALVAARICRAISTIYSTAITSIDIPPADADDHCDAGESQRWTTPVAGDVSSRVSKTAC